MCACVWSRCGVHPTTLHGIGHVSGVGGPGVLGVAQWAAHRSGLSGAFWAVASSLFLSEHVSDLAAMAVFTLWSRHVVMLCLCVMCVLGSFRLMHEEGLLGLHGPS